MLDQKIELSIKNGQWFRALFAVWLIWSSNVVSVVQKRMIDYNMAMVLIFTKKRTFTDNEN